LSGFPDENSARLGAPHLDLGRQPVVTLKVYVDASGQTWRDVPGYGRVNWPVEQIIEHARLTKQLHQPDGPILKVRLLWRVVPVLVLAHRECKVCLGTWMCREARWARWWLDSIERGWRHSVKASP
jgi:hypothetical protein